MKKEQNDPAAQTQPIVAGPQKESFRGYSMSELRYQRALTALQMEFCKSKITYNYNKARKYKFFSFGASDAKSSWVGRVLSGLHYTDYVLLGLSMYTSVKKIAGFLGHNKKKKKE